MKSVSSFAESNNSEAEASSNTNKKPTQSTEINWRRLSEEALSFFEAEQDAASFTALSGQLVSQGVKDRAIFERMASFYLRSKDRAALHQLFVDLSKRHRCKEPQKDTQTCQQLSQMWVSNLDSIFFYEDSASKSERLRRLLLVKDCSGAQAVLKELQAREGLLFPLLEAELKIAECLADIALQDSLRVKLEELRLFPSGI